MIYKDELIILFHVVLASVLSGIIGYEREKVDKPAGIRTNMLVGGAVALLISLGETIVRHFSETNMAYSLNYDPTRLIHAIIVGISFIGAGLVLQIQEQQKVKYLTTAATILFSTGIGIAVALEQYVLAVGSTFFILFVNYMLIQMAKLFKKLKEKKKK